MKINVVKKILLTIMMFSMPIQTAFSWPSFDWSSIIQQGKSSCANSFGSICTYVQNNPKKSSALVLAFGIGISLALNRAYQQYKERSAINNSLEQPFSDKAFTYTKETQKEEDSESKSIWWACAQRNGSVYKDMEDTYNINLNDNQYKLFAVYDGHGGTLAANVLAKGDQEKGIPSLTTFTLENLKKRSSNNPQEVLRETFVDMDKLLKGKFTKQVNTRLQDQEQFLREKRIGKGFTVPVQPIDLLDTTGSTAVLAIIDKTRKNAYLAWTGDSRAVVMSEEGTIMTKTDDHNAQNEKEVWRISVIEPNYSLKENGGRLGAVLTTRSFADFQVKREHKALKAEPDIQEIKIVNNPYIILASDGIWENIHEDELFRVMHYGLAVNEKKWLDDFASKKFEFFDDNFNEIYKSYATDEKDIILAGDNEQLKQFAQNIRDVAFYRNIEKSLGNKSLNDLDATIKSDNLTVLVIQVKVNHKS